ncbi:ABC transporter substrate-binding protein [Undibacterium sp. TC9W]|uniref:ABC transporter substrate-binding protein n=1 Tax=Undibacterium sp. TC9W TaxID=3413053 RepID=UPI003BF33CF5
MLLVAADSQARASVSTGTAFAITKNGHLVTNFHVIDGAKELFVLDQNKKAFPAQIVGKDPVNDLAILSIDKATAPLYLESNQKIRRGSEVSTLGFPNVGIQGAEAKFTNGTLTAESGQGDDIRNFQISTPIQPGNSGGPLLDSRGYVVGVIVSKLSDIYMLERQGEVGQNVNYAVKVQYLLAMIAGTRQVRDQILRAPVKTAKSREEVAEMAEEAVYLVVGTVDDKRKESESQSRKPPAAAQPESGSQEFRGNQQVASIPGTRLVRLGHVGPLTGAIGHLGRDNENGAKMAIEDLNSMNIVIGGQVTKFELITENDGADPRMGVSAAQRLVSMRVKGVVGHLNSGTSIPASEVYFQAGIPQISPSATNPQFTRQGFNTTFRMVANDEALASLIAKVATQDLVARKIAVIDDNTMYGAGIAYAFKRAAEAGGATIVNVQTVHNKATNFSAEVAAIKSSNPDLVFFGGMDSQAGPLLQQLAAQGVNVKFVGGDGICTADLPRLSNDAIRNDQVYCAEAGGVEASRTATLREFRRVYKDRFGMDVQIYAPYVYDAFYALAAAMVRAGSVEPSKYLAYIKGVRYNGVTGLISFDDNGDIQQPALTLYTYRNGKRALHHVAR